MVQWTDSSRETRFPGGTGHSSQIIERQLHLFTDASEDGFGSVAHLLRRWTGRRRFRSGNIESLLFRMSSLRVSSFRGQ